MEPLLVPVHSTYKNKVTVATLLDCSASTAKKLVYGGEIPSATLGRKRVVAVEDVRKFVEKLRRQAVA